MSSFSSISFRKDDSSSATSTRRRGISAPRGEAVRQRYKMGTRVHTLSTGNVLVRVYNKGIYLGLAIPKKRINALMLDLH